MDKFENSIVRIAGVAADLNAVVRIAWSVSIASKNAMVISAQAGEQARSFQPLTRFIDEIANQTIADIKKVEKESLHLTRLSTMQLRTSDGYQRFLSVKTRAGDARHLESFNNALVNAHRRLSLYHEQFSKLLRRLLEYMDELHQNMRAAQMVASLCKIEASRTGQFGDNLRVVADDLNAASSHIRDIIEKSVKEIEDISDKTRLGYQI
jgi:hypothetical protein